ASRPMPAVYDNEPLPRVLFAAAAVMTLFILCLLTWRLPDFFVRTLFWARCLGRYRIKVVGMHNLPTNGPVILATNCTTFDSSLQVIAATDRHTYFILAEEGAEPERPPRLLYYLARQAGFTTVPAGPEAASVWPLALTRAHQALARHDLLALSVDGDEHAAAIAR